MLCLTIRFELNCNGNHKALLSHHSKPMQHPVAAINLIQPFLFCCGIAVICAIDKKHTIVKFALQLCSDRNRAKLLLRADWIENKLDDQRQLLTLTVNIRLVKLQEMVCCGCVYVTLSFNVPSAS